MREGILVLFMAAGIVSIAYSQELVHYSFEESMLATQQTNQQFIVNSLNDNPLLEDYDVKFYGLDVQVNNRSDQIHGSATILVEVKRNSFSTLVFELYHTLGIDRVLVDGTEMNFTHADNELYIDLAAPRDSGILVTAQVYYGGETGEGMVMETDDEWGVRVTFTHSEPFYSKD